MIDARTLAVNEHSERLSRHNKGMENYTSKYLPWEMVWSTEKADRAEAMGLEKKLKNLSRVRLGAFMKKYSQGSNADEA